MKNEEDKKLVILIEGNLINESTQEIVAKTEIFHIQNVLNNGKFTLLPTMSTRINDFWITYNQQNNIKQFYSDLSLLNNNGTELKHQTIFVNSPMIYKGLYYYQTDWNLVALRIKMPNSQIFQYPLINLLDSKNKIWVTWIPNNFTCYIISIQIII